MEYVHLINETNKHSLNKPANTDRVYYSELLEWFTNNAFRSFSIKLVVEGAIHYRCGNTEYCVTKDHFLLTSKQPDVAAYFNSKQLVKSICIDICPASFSDAFAVLHAKENEDPDQFISGYFEHPHFFEQVYAMQGSLFGAQLKKLSHALCNGQYHPGMINEDWFMKLVELIVMQEKGNYVSLNSIPAKKTSTRKEIYQRVLHGRAYMEAYCLQNPPVADIARQCNLSAFHFFRSFRQAFAMSPYQYMLQLRLQHALKMIQLNQLTLTEIAYCSGFPDLFTFSKAFKRMYGATPSRYVVEADEE